MKKILSNLLFVTFIIAVVIFIIYKFNSNKLHEAPFGVCILQVSSNSMFPHFSRGDFIIIKKQDNYEIGDIITFQNEENCLITHRIIKKYKNDIYITKGDANNIEDEKEIQKKVIYGKVIHIFENIFGKGET